MKSVSSIRLLSYAMCLGALVLAVQERRVIPVLLWGFNETDALEESASAAKFAAAIPKRKDFRNTQLSGSDVVGKAIAAAKSKGIDLSVYGEPQITLIDEEGKLVWSVSYYHIPVFPGGFFTVWIDDTSGEATIYPGM